MLKCVRFYLNYLADGKYQRYVKDFGCGEFKGFRALSLNCSSVTTMRWIWIKRVFFFYTLGILGKPGAPTNILKKDDLEAWGGVVHHAVTDSVKELMGKLGQDGAKLNMKGKGFLEIW